MTDKVQEDYSLPAAEQAIQDWGLDNGYTFVASECSDLLEVLQQDQFHQVVNMVDVAALKKTFCKDKFYDITYRITTHDEIYAYNQAIDDMNEARYLNAWQPTHKHKIQGGEYQYVGVGRTQSNNHMPDLTEVVIYKEENGTLWARDYDEFYDGRFEELPQPPKGEE